VSDRSAFADPDDVADRLRATGYLTDEAIATVVFLGDRLGKPLLVEGPAGVGKTELARALATARGARLVRLQCYEGLDEAKALYEWNYRKQLLRIQASEKEWEETAEDIFGPDYLLERPLLRSITGTEPTVLLIDEVDKVDFEFEALLLELLADFAVTIPELGTMTATQHPTVVLTSNNTRELSEALKRRCLYLHMDYPDIDREREIVLTRVPEVPEQLADQLVRIVRSLRQLELRKAPAIAETIDWARSLLALGLERVDQQSAARTLTVLLKHHSDVDKALAHLQVPAAD
jgi:MoxR-like ATPase